MQQQIAPLDCLAHLAGPPAKANRGAAALFGGQLLAYAAASAVVVVDVQRMAAATTLAGAHRQAAVSALAWHPGGGPREPRAAAQLRLASGDEEGRVMVWNVNTGAVIAALEDPWASAFGTATGARRPEGGGGPAPGRPPVVGLAWATASSSVLAVLLAPCVLLLWDYRTGGIVWRKDFGASEAFTSLQVDPLDRRRLVLCGSKGSFIVLSLTNPAADKVKHQQYQVDIGTGGTLRCAFSETQDLLFLLLQRELIVFDLEYGQPAASSPLPASRAPLDDLLGCYGHAAAGKPLREGGIDVLYCSHRDGSVSVWQRHARLLTYSCLGATKLMPAALKFGSAPTLLALTAGLWHGLSVQQDASAAADLTSQASLLNGGSARRPPGMARRVASGSDVISVQRTGSGQAAAGSRGSLDAGGSGTACCGAKQEASGHSVLLMGVASDGRVWQWQLPLLSGTLPDGKPSTLSPAPKPELLGLLHTLPQRVTAFSASPAPVALPATPGVVAPVAAATASGTIELLAVQQGALLPLQLGPTASLAAHPGPVQGVRWLGGFARLVSHSTEKVAGGYRNTLLITDVRNRLSLPFRQVPVDPVPLGGVRTSPSGRYLLLLFRGAPSEIWSVGGGAAPTRLRQVDLQFTAVEWLVPAEAGPGSSGGQSWSASPRAAERAAAGYPFAAEAGEEAPEERLAFSLADGRAGLLGIRGRRISDTRPRRPAWQALANGDFRAVALGSWGNSVLLGDAEGTLAHWDTASGRCAMLETGMGRVHRILAGPPAAASWYPAAGAVQARLAVLFASGLCAVYDLDQQGELRPTHVTGAAWAARIGRTADVQWLPLPSPVGAGTVLAASLEDGTLALFDTVHTMEVRPRRTRMLRYQAMLHAAAPSEAGASQPHAWGLLAGPPPVAAPPLLPRAWGLLLRLLLQRGLPEAVFRELGALAAALAGSATQASSRTLQAEQALERLEGELWSRLPRACQAAWEKLQQRSEAGEAPAEAPELRQLLEAFAAGTEEEEEAGSSVLDLAAPGATPVSPTSRDAGSTQRDEAAAAALGLASRAGSATVGSGRRRSELASTFKSLGGAFKGIAKDMASVSKSQLKTLAGAGGRQQQPFVTAVAGISDGYEHSPSRAAFTSLVAVLHAIATARDQPALLSPAELTAYGAVLASHRTADRMAFAAELMGDEAEAAFWRRLPATLAWLQHALESSRRRSSSGRASSTDDATRGASSGLSRTTADSSSAAGNRPPLGGSSHGGSVHGGGPSPKFAAGAAAAAASAGGSSSGGRRLWEEGLELAEARERSGWHEQMSRRVFENSEDLQEKRVLEYVALGDFQTAVGFLLASPPGRSTRYYRDALCTLGMAFACGLQQAGGTAGALLASAGAAAAAGGAPEDSAARTLFVQAAKVITANAASVGDTLLGVPLLCSTGQHADAASILQDSGLWRYASALVAHSLKDVERAAAMERWAGHVAAAEGRPWAAAGLLVAAGALKSALQLLRQHCVPDAAVALVAACRDAGLPLHQAAGAAGSSAGPAGAAAGGAGELENLFVGSGQATRPLQRFNSSGERLAEREEAAGGDHAGAAQLQRTSTLTDYERSETAREFQLYVCEVLQQL